MLGVGRVRPILSAAYFSQPKSRFTPPEPRGWPSLAELRCCCSGGLQRGSWRNFAMRCEAPKCNKKLARHCHDRDTPETTAVGPDALLEPPAQPRCRLMSKPQPSRLDHRGPQARIAGFRDSLFLFHIAT